MLAFLWNLSLQEIMVIAIVAVLVFGRRLPQVAGQAMRNIAKLRRQLDDLRRESGIDREIYDVKGTFTDLGREMKAEPSDAPYPGNMSMADRKEPEPEPQSVEEEQEAVEAHETTAEDEDSTRSEP